MFLAVGLIAMGGCTTKSAAKHQEAVSHAKSQVEQGPVRVTAEVQPAQPQLSDEPTLTLTIDHKEGVTIEKPEFGSSLGKFTIRNVRDLLPKTDNGRVIVQQIYTLEPTEPGRLRIDPIPVSFSYKPTKENEKPKKHTLETKPLVIEVTSIVGEKTPKLTDLRGPAAPLSLGSNTEFLAAIAFILVVAIVAFIAWRRRHARHAAPTTPTAVLTPEELANMELDKLVASGLAARDIKQFYVALTSIVRRFIERTTGVRAPEQTTEEFLREITRTKQFEQSVTIKLRYFLESADLVKFAAHQPNQEDIAESVRRARLFVASRNATDVNDMETETPNNPIK